MEIVGLFRGISHLDGVIVAFPFGDSFIPALYVTQFVGEYWHIRWPGVMPPL